MKSTSGKYYLVLGLCFLIGVVVFLIWPDSVSDERADGVESSAGDEKTRSEGSAGASRMGLDRERPEGSDTGEGQGKLTRDERFEVSARLKVLIEYLNEREAQRTSEVYRAGGKDSTQFGLLIQMASKEERREWKERADLELEKLPENLASALNKKYAEKLEEYAFTDPPHHYVILSAPGDAGKPISYVRMGVTNVDMDPFDAEKLVFGGVTRSGSYLRTEGEWRYSKVLKFDLEDVDPVEVVPGEGGSRSD